MNKLAVALVAVFCGLPASLGQPPIIDGRNIPTEFVGGLVATQGIQTGWGNHINPGQSGSGSELDQLFVCSDISDGFLSLAVSGNLESPGYSSLTGNGYVFFLDTKPGGENVLDANGGYQPYGDRYVCALNGTRFDPGFWPDYGLVINASGDPGYFYVDLVDLQANARRYVGRGLLGSQSGILNSGTNPGNWQVALDNSNTLGVGGGTAGAPDSNAHTATTGVEILISAAELGLVPGSTLGIQVLLNSGGLPSWISNQNLPSLPDYTQNLGPILPDYSTIQGQQYATLDITPEPSTIVLLALLSCPVFGKAKRRR